MTTTQQAPGVTRKNSADSTHHQHQVGAIQQATAGAAAYMLSARSRFTRRSCGDAYSLLEAEDDGLPRATMVPAGKGQAQGQQQRQEADYRLVTAMPAFIVEHEPEKQRGLGGVWGLRRVSKKIDSFRRSSSRETICTIPERPDGKSIVNNNNNAKSSNNNSSNNNNNNNTNNNVSNGISNNLDSTNNNQEAKSAPNNVNVNNNNHNGHNGHNDKKSPVERRFFHGSSRSPSPFKSFFIRMGSTGMLNSSAKNRRSSQNLEDKIHDTPEKENLFRSCSTSQLNTSPTYVKGDDPSEGIDLRSIDPRNEQHQHQQHHRARHHGKTASCDNLSGRRSERHVDDDSCSIGSTTSAYDADLPPPPARSSSAAASRIRSFGPCDLGDPNARTTAEQLLGRKSNSCDLGKEAAKKTNFPYAFLRSRLSVLPEERLNCAPGSAAGTTGSTLSCGGALGGREERLFKTASEEHFPALKIEDTFDGTTTLGRRRPPKSSYARHLGDAALRYGTTIQQQYQQQQDRSLGYGSGGAWYSRNSYSEFGEDRRRFEAYEQRGGGGDYYGEDSVSLPYQGVGDADHSPIVGTTANNNTSATTPSSSSPGPMTTALLRHHHRRNSAPSSGEQRLSSHYVSSNESGYDSDGPRGESAASEAEPLSLKCPTDGSDTSSVVDSEPEKPMRSSTPSECRVAGEKLGGGVVAATATTAASYLEEGGSGSDAIDGLGWHHQSASGRLLPSIHRTNSPSSSPSSSSSSSLSNGSTPTTTMTTGNTATDAASLLGLQGAAHRVRLQQDKTKFLSDIIQQPVARRVRRSRMVQLTKADPKESLGIRLAQQRVGEVRYVIVQLETDGIAHRDGRLRLGDEIVEVEGRDLRTLSSLDEVQDFLRSCEGTRVRLRTAYEETMPQLYPESRGSTAESDGELGLASMTVDEQITNGSAEDSRDCRRPTSSLELDAYQRFANGQENHHYHQQQQQLQQQQQQQQQQQLQYATRHAARFEKGLGKPSLGFSVVGGRDSPRGDMGIFVRRVFPGGQADLSKALFQGDEILTLNGKILKGCTHQEVIELFKAVREGPVELELTRRHRYHQKVPPLKTAAY